MKMRLDEKGRGYVRIFASTGDFVGDNPGI